MCHADLPTQAHFCPYCAEPVRELAQAVGQTAELPILTVPEQPCVNTPAEGQPHRGSAGRRSLFVLSTACIALIVAVVITVVVSRDDRRTADAESMVGTAASEGAKPWILVTEAATARDLRRAGQAVPAAMALVESQLAEVSRLGDGDTRRAVRTFLDAELALLGALTPLADLDQEQSDSWPAIGEAGQVALDRLRSATTALPKPATATSAGIVAATTRALPHLRTTLDEMRGRITAWRTEVEKARAERKTGLDALDAYAGPFRAQMERYGRLRGEVAEYVSRIASTKYEDDYRFFSEARAKRNEVREALSSYTPPAGLAAAHAQINAVVDRSIGAIDEAVSGLSRSQARGESFRNTDGWKTFMSRSEEISAAWRNAVWDKVVADERDRLNAIDDPPRPAI